LICTATKRRPEHCNSRDVDGINDLNAELRKHRSPTFDAYLSLRQGWDMPTRFGSSGAPMAQFD
jgi:hypothetical protein